MPAEAHTSRAHAKLSPSSGYIWSICPGMPRETEGIENKASVFADEGTAAHTLGEKCLRNDVDAVDFLGGHVDIFKGTISREPNDGATEDNLFDINEDMVEAVQVYLDECRQYMGDGWDWEIEAKLDLRHIPGMQFGTGDFTAYHPDQKKLVIRDFKYGKGKVVEVFQNGQINPQLGIYAEGVAKRYHNRGLSEIDIGIVQPRAPHTKGPVRTHTLDALDLVDFHAQLVGWATATLDPDAPLVAGPHCTPFCRKAASCATLRQYTLAAAEMEFADTPPVVTDMAPADKARILAKAEVIEGWIKRVKEAAHQDALDGNGPPGFKLVESTTHRKFKDDTEPSEMAKWLGVAEADLMTEPKLRTPAQVEKLIGKKNHHLVADYIFRPRGKIILVADSDPRPAVKQDAEEEFAK